MTTVFWRLSLRLETAAKASNVAKTLRFSDIQDVTTMAVSSAKALVVAKGWRQRMILRRLSDARANINGESGHP